MGRHDTPLDLRKENNLPLSAPLTVFAASEQLDALHLASDTSWIGELHLHAVDLDEDLPTDALRSADIVVVHVDPRVPRSMDRIRTIHRVAPELPQIVAIDNASVSLVRTLLREGVSDVVSVPIDPEELLQAALTVLEGRSVASRHDVPLAPLVAVTRALGGSGATSLSTHLAAQFVEHSPRGSTCLIDLDIQFGRVSEVLGLAPRRGLGDLLEAGERLDSAFLHSVAARHDTGLSVIAAPLDIVPLEAVDAAQLRRVIELARREFDHVFVDLPSNLANWGLALIAEADSVLLVVEQTVQSLRQARRRIELFKAVGIDPRAISIVVNRYERRLFGSISLADIEETLGLPVTAGLPVDSQLAAAQDQGLLVRRTKAKSSFGAGVADFAQDLDEQLRMRRKS